MVEFGDNSALKNLVKTAPITICFMHPIFSQRASYIFVWERTKKKYIRKYNTYIYTVYKFIRVYVYTVYRYKFIWMHCIGL